MIVGSFPKAVSAFLRRESPSVYYQSQPFKILTPSRPGHAVFFIQRGWRLDESRPSRQHLLNEISAGLNMRMVPPSGDHLVLTHWELGPQLNHSVWIKPAPIFLVGL